MATVRLYNNTGFDAVNGPASATVLQGAASSMYSYEVDIIQAYNLDNVRLPLTESAVLNVDYCSITMAETTCYYAVISHRMASSNVAILSLVMDPIMTAGGAENISVLAGMAERIPYRMADRSDRMSVIDPMAICTRPHAVRYTSMAMRRGGTSEDDYALVACTVDLSTVTLDTSDLYTWNDVDGTVQAAHVPAAITDSQTAVVHLPWPAGMQVSDPEMTVRTYGYALYDYTNDTVKKAVQQLRLIGMDTSVIGAYKLPKNYVTVTFGDGGIVKEITSLGSDTQAGIPVPYHSAAAVVYGDESKTVPKQWDDLLRAFQDYKIGIVSMGTGNTVESSGASASNNVWCLIDPRVDGRPYYMLAKIDNVPSDVLSDDDFKRDRWYGVLSTRCAAGAGWDVIPVITSNGSGALIAGQVLAKRQEVIQQNADADYQYGLVTTGLGLGAALADGSLSSMGDLSSGFGSRTVGLMSAIGNLGIYGMTGSQTALNAAGESLENFDPKARADRLRRREAALEGLNWISNYRYVAPDVKGAVAAGLVQFVGNGCICYAVGPQEADMERYDKCAALFGIAVSQPVEGMRLTHGPLPCDYYKITGASVHVAPNVPRDVRGAIVQALSAGIRIWWQRPGTVGAMSSYS